jgi:hypothetical protein
MTKCGKATSRIVPLAGFVLALSASIGAASAQEVVAVDAVASSPGLLDRPLYVGVGIGGVFGLSGGAGSGMFRLEEDFGYHVWQTGKHPGLFVGLLANQSFVSGAQNFDIDARAGFDINVYDWGSGALLVTPGTALGVSISHSAESTFTDPYTGATTTIGGTTAAFNIMFNCELRAVLVGGLLSIWFRPVGIEVVAMKGATGANWDLNTGVLFNF